MSGINSSVSRLICWVKTDAVGCVEFEQPDFLVFMQARNSALVEVPFAEKTFLSVAPL